MTNPINQPDQPNQAREYAIYQPHLGRLVLQAGPGPHWVCSEANTMLKGYVLPYQGQEIEPGTIPALIQAGWLPTEFQFPLVGYCPVCRRDVDTEPRSGGIRVCVVCYTQAQIYQLERNG